VRAVLSIAGKWQLLLIQFNGNLCGQYHSAIERVGRYARLFEELCLLPGTIDPYAGHR